MTRPFTNRSQFHATATLVALLIAVAAAAVAYRRQAAQQAQRTRQEPALIVRNDAEIRDRDIAFYAARTLEDTSGAADRESLAALLFARGRYTGSEDDLARAERLARQSVALRAARNGQAFELLANVLMDRHAFREARAIMFQADSLAPGTPSHLALLGEIELELGEYEAAAAHFKAIRLEGEQFTIAARVARWYELTGRAQAARELFERAIKLVSKRDDLPREQVAWFHYRLGELELRQGRLLAADSAFRAGLRVNDDDLRVLGGLTRLAVARGEWQQAIDYGARATAVQLDPATVGAMSRAYAALGDTAQAASFAQAMSVSALAAPGAVHRAWGLFLLDHGTAADRRKVLRLARRGIRDRQDVYGYDLLAWALFRTGSIAEAQVVMLRALAQNTEDVMLREHARVIGCALTRSCAPA